MIQLQNEWGQFTPKYWGQFAPEYWGQFHAEKWGLFGRNFQCSVNVRLYSFMQDYTLQPVYFTLYICTSAVLATFNL